LYARAHPSTDNQLPPGLPRFRRPAITLAAVSCPVLFTLARRTSLRLHRTRGLRALTYKRAANQAERLDGVEVHGCEVQRRSAFFLNAPRIDQAVTL